MRALALEPGQIMASHYQADPPAWSTAASAAEKSFARSTRGRKAFALPRCSGDNITRENIMRQAANLKDFRTEVLLPRVMINTSPSDFAPIRQLQLPRFKGERWEPFRDVISGDVGG